MQATRRGKSYQRRKSRRAGKGRRHGRDEVARHGRGAGGGPRRASGRGDGAGRDAACPGATLTPAERSRCRARATFASDAPARAVFMERDCHRASGRGLRVPAPAHAPRGDEGRLCCSEAEDVEPGPGAQQRANGRSPASSKPEGAGRRAASSPPLPPSTSAKYFRQQGTLRARHQGTVPTAVSLL